MGIHDEATEPDVLDEALAELGLTDDEVEAVQADESTEEATTEEDVLEDATTEEDVLEDATTEEDALEESAELADVSFAPQFQAESTAGLSEQMDTMTADYNERSDALAATYEAGDTTFSEYRKQDRALNEDFDHVKQQYNEALLEEKIATNHSQQSADQKWEMEQNVFYADNSEYKTDDVLRGALGAQLEQLYGVEDNVGKSGLWFLQEAAKLLDGKFGNTKGESKLEAARDKQRKQAGKDLGIPASLSNVPAADTNSDGGEFAHMDSLAGLEYESAIARMPEAVRERFMAS